MMLWTGTGWSLRVSRVTDHSKLSHTVMEASEQTIPIDAKWGPMVFFVISRGLLKRRDPGGRLFPFRNKLGVGGIRQPRPCAAELEVVFSYSTVQDPAQARPRAVRATARMNFRFEHPKRRGLSFLNCFLSLEQAKEERND